MGLNHKLNVCHIAMDTYAYQHRIPSASVGNRYLLEKRSMGCALQHQNRSQFEIF